MRNLKMISVMLLIAFSLYGCKSEDYNIDKSFFSVEHQKFYQSNQYTGVKAEFPPTDMRADKLICAPYDQYIDFFDQYVCTKKK